MNPRARISMYVGGEKKRANLVRGGSCQATPLLIGEIARVCYARKYVLNVAGVVRLPQATGMADSRLGQGGREAPTENLK